MSIRKTLPLFLLFLLGACASNTDGRSPQPLATVDQAYQGDDDAGDDAPDTCLPDGGGPSDDDDGDAPIRHVLLLSVDGFHEADLARFIDLHPDSTIAKLAETGVRYRNAHTTTPSDSFPGMLSFVTGGTPKSTGVYYDDSYDRTLFAPGSGCKGRPGTEVVYDESIEVDSSRIFSPISPNNLPHQLHRNGACKPVMPHDFVKVNTVFEVIRSAGGYTAWADKHAAYDILNGPSGKGVADLYTPEVGSLIKDGGVVNGVDLTASLKLCDGTTNSLPLNKVDTYTTCEPAVAAYDDTKVQAVINEINGKTADGKEAAPTPTILGMNFQAVSVGEKLPVGGYVNASDTPSALLDGAIRHVDESIGRFVAALKARHIFQATLVIVSAKHGQSPIDPAKLAMEAGGHGNATVTDPLGFVNAADPNVDQLFSTFVNPNSGSAYAVDGHLQTDDVGIVWLQDQSRTNVDAVVAQLEDPAHRAAMFADKLPPGTIVTSSVSHGNELADIFGDPTSGDPIAAARAPNLFIQPNWGVIYSGSGKKIAEHGGGSLDDTHVALLVSNPAIRHRVLSNHVQTTQVAPTILRALHLDPDALEAVRKERTKVLPGLKL